MGSGKEQSVDPFVHAAHQAVLKAGWDPRYDLEIREPDGSSQDEKARYGQHGDRVRLVRSPELMDHLGQTLQNLTQPENAVEALRDVVASRVFLQIGSFKVCPYSAFDYAELLEASADGLRSAGTPEPDVRDFTVPVTSFFIASVISAVYAVEGSDPRAFRRGWQLDHINLSLTHDRTLPAYVAVFVNIQLRFWSQEKDLAEAVRRCYPVPLDTLEFETDRGSAILLDTFDFVGYEVDGLVWSDPRTCDLMIDELKYGWRKWPVKAFQFAEMLAPYVVSEERGRTLPPALRPALNERGGRPSEQARERWFALAPATSPDARQLLNQEGLSTDELVGAPPDPFARRLATDSTFRQRLAQSCVGRGCNPLAYHMGFDALDALYRERVVDLRVESDTRRKPGMSLDIAHMSREEIGNGLPDFSCVDWGATRRGPDGNLHLYTKKLPITDQTPVSYETGGFPDMLLVVDSSGSMRWDPVKGTGPYDSLLRAIYSVFHFLEANTKAQYMRFAAVNFSSTTLKTPWHSYPELKEVKKLLFKHQAGGTTLDCAVLRSIAESSSDRFLCLMVTDSQISNAAKVAGVIQKMAGEGHQFVLIQIGRPAAMTQAVQSYGHAVHIVSDHTQLAGLCLKFAAEAWGSARA